MKKYEHVPIKELSGDFERWQAVLLKGEIGHVCFLPHTGLLYRVHQFVDWTNSSGGRLKVIDFDVDLGGETVTMKRVLDSAEIGEVLVIVMRSAFLTVDGWRLAALAQQAHIQSKNPILFFHEAAPCQLANHQESVMQTNVMMPALLSKLGIEKYVERLSGDWGVEISKSEVSSLISYCGNQLWLINEGLRLKMDHPEWEMKQILENEKLQIKCQIIWKGLPDIYRSRLLNIGGSIDERISIEMQNYGLLSGGQVIECGYLLDLVQKNKYESLVVTENRVEWMKNDLTSHFSTKERLILYIMKNNVDNVISRDELAKNIWGDKAYSDWSLDKIMSRLRTKIARLNLPLRIITKKKKGFCCEWI